MKERTTKTPQKNRRKQGIARRLIPRNRMTRRGKSAAGPGSPYTLRTDTA